MDPLQWMGAVRMKLQTADKNITIIHTTPVHQFTPYEAKSCLFAGVFNFQPLLLAKIQSIIHNNLKKSVDLYFTNMQF